MRRLRSVVGLLLCVLASVLVAASVVVDPWQERRRRRREAAERQATADRAERLRLRVREVRQLADEQAEAVRRRTVRICNVTLAAVLLTSSAMAEPACRRENDRVSCDAVEFAGLLQTHVDTSAALDRCLAASPLSRSPLPAIGYAVGVLGAVAVGVAAASLLRSPDVSQVGLGAAGLGAVAVGVALVW